MYKGLFFYIIIKIIKNILTKFANKKLYPDLKYFLNY